MGTQLFECHRQFYWRAISNAYYPAVRSRLGLTIEPASRFTAEGAVGSFLEEFYPDFIAWRRIARNVSWRSYRRFDTLSIYRLNSSRSRLVCERSRGISVCLRSSMRS